MRIDKRIGMFLITVITIGLIGLTAFIPRIADHTNSTAVLEEELKKGYHIALFDPMYRRDNKSSSIDYTTRTLHTKGEKGLLIQGPNLTLPTGTYELDISGIAENLQDDKTYLHIQITGEQTTIKEIDLKKTELEQGHTTIKFKLADTTDYVSWNLTFENEAIYQLAQISIRKV